MDSTNQKISSVPKMTSLRAGQLTMLFDSGTGFLRYVRLGDHEIVRAIYGAVRDHEWNTIRPRIENLNISSQADSFQVSFAASSMKEGIHFDWECIIAGQADRVIYTFEGEAKSTFLKNRIGLCVLHPLLECAGSACTVEHVNGRIENGAFPKFILPDQPFKDIRAVRYEAAPGVLAEVRFEGETFEMEDQRNWTDGSFKTYSTPVDLPKPVEIAQGARVSHRVIISLPGPPRRILPAVQSRPAQISFSTAPLLPKPSIGFSLGSEPESLSANLARRLTAIRPAHLRVDIDFRKDSWRAKLAEATQISRVAGAPLHVALLLSGDIEARLDELVSLATDLDPRIKLWLLYSESENPVSRTAAGIAMPKLLAFNQNILIAIGSRENFADLNRNRPDPGSGTLPVFSISPQIHTIDELSIIDNLDGQRPTIETAYQFSKQIVVVSPVTLLPAEFGFSSDNPVSDPRQKSLFAAVWTIGSLSKLLPSPQLHSLTYYRVNGPHGIMDEREAYPLWHVFRDLADFGRIFPAHSTHPLEVAAITLVDDRERRRLLVANLLADSQQVKLETKGAKAKVRYLDDNNLDRAMRDPEQFNAEPGDLVEPTTGIIELDLKPYAIGRVDLE